MESRGGEGLTVCCGAPRQGGAEALLGGGGGVGGWEEGERGQAKTEAALLKAFLQVTVPTPPPRCPHSAARAPRAAT